MMSSRLAWRDAVGGALGFPHRAKDKPGLLRQIFIHGFQAPHNRLFQKNSPGFSLTKCPEATRDHESQDIVKEMREIAHEELGMGRFPMNRLINELCARNADEQQSFKRAFDAHTISKAVFRLCSSLPIEFQV